MDLHRQLATFVFALVVTLACVGIFALLWAFQPSYFPRGALDAEAGQSEFRNGWYSSHLHVMGEPILRVEPGVRTYRFTWLRTDHHPVSIRIACANGKAHLVAVELDGAGGYGPGSIFRREDIALSASQFADVDHFVTQSGFFDMDSNERLLGHDGSRWIVESVTTKYRVVDRWSPTSGPVREIGLHFLSLAGWTFPEREMY